MIKIICFSIISVDFLIGPQYILKCQLFQKLRNLNIINNLLTNINA